MAYPAAAELAEISAAARPWLGRMARLGYASKGLVYVLVGWIAARAALGDGETEGSHGALAFLLDQPFGKGVLLVVACGLAGYAAWRTTQAIADPEGKGRDAKGLAVRAYMLASAAIHAALVLAAVRLLTGDHGAAEDGAQSLTARLMAQPAGRWLVGVVGLLVIVAACQQAWLAIGEGYRRRVRVERLDPAIARWVGPVARLGLLARALVFLVIGGFLLVAAVRADPGEAKGLGDALRTLQQQAAGPALLLLVALGLVAYGLYELVKARYREIALPGGAANAGADR